MYKHLYAHFLQANSDKLHFACHSHHYWPDATRAAHNQYWEDSCKYVDDKWSFIFGQKIPAAQKLIAENLNLSHPDHIVFAPNTHELVFRLLSSLDWSQKKLRILTTDSEFYSFERQIRRLAELPQFEVVYIPTLPFGNFHERFTAELRSQKFDFIFVSQVFFNSGLVCDFKKFIPYISKDSLFVVDGYHAFMAVPTDLKSVEKNIFYLAGGYKYAQGGEGVCFMAIPPGTKHRPFNTGWFAQAGPLDEKAKSISYPENAFQYAGSTMDFSGLYRLTATLETLKKENLTVEKIHAYVQKNQNLFLAEIKKISHPLIKIENLLVEDLNSHGHFLTFTLPSTEITQKLVQDLKQKNLIVDSRENRLRFGFGLYHNEDDIRKVPGYFSGRNAHNI